MEAEKRKNRQLCFVVAMLTSKRFAFMFKPLPVKSKTEQKRSHTDTQTISSYNTAVGTLREHSRPLSAWCGNEEATADSSF